jgi:hypothetical protein
VNDRIIEYQVCYYFDWLNAACLDKSQNTAKLNKGIKCKCPPTSFDIGGHAFIRSESK